jgi:hypothetical protein
MIQVPRLSLWKTLTATHLETSMIVQKIKTISHHRNGISGEPFYCVEFVFQNNTKKWNMIATFDPENPSLTRVLCITNPVDGWRGDNLFDLIIEEVGKAIKQGSIEPESLVWANALMAHFKQGNRECDGLASDGYPMEKFDGLTPADHGTHTP